MLSGVSSSESGTSRHVAMWQSSVPVQSAGCTRLFCTSAYLHLKGIGVPTVSTVGNFRGVLRYDTSCRDVRLVQRQR